MPECPQLRSAVSYLSLDTVKRSEDNNGEFAHSYSSPAETAYIKVLCIFSRTVAYAAEKLNDHSGTIQNQAFHSHPHAEV